MAEPQLLADVVARAAASTPIAWDGRGGEPPYRLQYARLLEVVGDAREWAYGSMVYACRDCAWEHRVWLGVGIEGPPALTEHEATIPAPFMAGRCGGCNDGQLSHVRWNDDETWDELRPIPAGQAAFVVPTAEDADRLAQQSYGGAEYISPPIGPRPDDDEPHLRCTACGFEVTKGASRDLRACPRCGDTSAPMAIADDVEIKVNWHELRVLGIWAEQWASRLDGNEQRIVNVICGRIHAQHPEKAPLTMSSEIGQVRQEFGDVEVEGFDEDEEANRGDR